MSTETTTGPKKNEWKIRRRIIFSTLTFCALVICYILWEDMKTEVAEAAMTAAFALAGMVIGSYVFGAVWDDHNVRKLDNGDDAR